MEQRETGERIRTLRERKAWTQQHLADAASISPRTVQRAEEGVMSAETRAAIAGALDVPVESLAAATKPPTGWPRITPTLVYEDSKTAVDWLEKAFGFLARIKVPGPGGQVFVDDLDEHYARAKAAGAEIVQEIQTGYGFRRYRALDLEGHEWCFAVKTDE
jgi:transcriptional regulator with XRE-family HTH domain